MTILEELLSNKILVPAIISLWLAQFLKVPIYYYRYRKWNWGLWFTTGDMPSSHSALVSSTMLSVGLYEGFDTAAFAISVAISMIVVYDAAGVRREAGKHAQKINQIIEELFRGQPISEETLKEVLGHTRKQVIAGIMLGWCVSLAFWNMWV